MLANIFTLFTFRTNSMSREFTITEFRKYIKSLDPVQEDEWAAMDESLSQIAQLVGLDNKIPTSWVVVLVMASRK